MAKLRTISGKDLLRIFASFDFLTFSQRGSHIKLRRNLPSGVRQTLTIVNHAEVDAELCRQSIARHSGLSRSPNCGRISTQIEQVAFRHSPQATVVDQFQLT
jgi:predicted RNA binding protein YcfA (HicA-like mRNA interferase family)